MDIQELCRGNMHWRKHYPNGDGTSNHPCIIVSNNAANRSGRYITVVPVTSDKEQNEFLEFIPFKSKPRPSAFVEKIEPHPSLALVGSIRTIPRETLGTYMGTVSEELMDKIEESLLRYLGLSDEVVEYPQIVVEKKELKNSVLLTTPASVADELSEQVKKSKTFPKPLGDAFMLEFLKDYKDGTYESLCSKYKVKNKTQLSSMASYYRKALIKKGHFIGKIKRCKKPSKFRDVLKEAS